MENTCARCGKPQSEMPETIIQPDEMNELDEPVVYQRFALYDADRDLYICHECLELYNELVPMATQVPMLADMPELLKQLMTQVPENDMEFFKKLV